MSTPQELLHSLAQAFVLTLERDPADPALKRALGDARDASGEVGWLVVRVEPLELLAGGVAVPAAEGDMGKLRDALLEAGILELRLYGALEPEILEDFLRRLHPFSGAEAPLPSARFRGLEAEVGLSFRKSPVLPPGMSGSIRKLFDLDKLSPPEIPLTEALPAALGDPIGDAPPPTEAVPAAGGAAGDIHPVRDSGPVDLVLERAALPPASPGPLPSLEEEVWALLKDLGPSRGDRLTRLRESLSPLQEARDHAGLARVVQFLVEAAGEASENEDVLELSRELTTAPVASHLVARLGAERDEEVRNRLTRDLARLGREAAMALADALVEAGDRFQRRSFVDALVVMGPLGMEMAQEMVLDPRWFVVRNGVAILGDLGGEPAVAPVTSALAHKDHRVRKESVLALAKLGGEDAVQLLLGMIDDPDTGVRAAACRALGALEAEKALRPLLTLLESEKDEDVQVECLRALGQLGDPGAVPLLEKKAVGRLFSRTSRDVRIAAYRALAGIGTPRAKALLEKAAQESDLGIRTVVRSLLSQG